MKAMTNLVKLAVVIVLSITIFSCEGEDGPIGPVGPQGEQGPQGDQGPEGETGTANVIYSDWIDSPFGEVGGLPQALALITDIPELTEEIVNSGVVLVYGGTTGANDPSTVIGAHGLPTVRFGDTHQFNIALNTIILNIRQGSSNGITGGGDYKAYRYVIIPGGVAAAKSADSIDYAKMSYKEIVELFDIKE